MASLLPPTEWAKFKDLIYQAHETFNNEVITWKKRLYFVTEFNEDPLEAGYDTIQLNTLMAGNYFRTWPITDATSLGEIDKESTVALLNRKYLYDNGYLNSQGNFNFSAADDRFVWHGMEHKCMGWVDVAHADDEHLLVLLILKREETIHGALPIEAAPISIIDATTDISDLSAIVLDFTDSTDSEGSLLPIAGNIYSKVVIYTSLGEIIASYTIARSTGTMISGTIPAGLSHDPATDILTFDATTVAPGKTLFINYTVIQDNVAGTVAILEIPNLGDDLLEQGGSTWG